MSTGGSYTNTAGINPSEGTGTISTGAEASSRPHIDPRSLDLAHIGLPKDVVVALSLANIKTVGDLLAADLSEVIQIEGVGRGSVRRMRLWLSSHGLMEGAISLVPPSPTRRGTVRTALRRTGEVMPLPAGMENAPVPLNILPARVANLLRKHHLTTMGRLHAVLSGPVRFEGFGAGTRQTAIELLPEMLRAASLPQAETEMPTQTRSLVSVLVALRSETRRPVRLEQMAAMLKSSPEALRRQAAGNEDFLYIDPWCLLADLQGLVDAGQVLPAGAVGDWIVSQLAKILSPVEYEVLIRWIGLRGMPERHAEIARSLNRSRERIRQLRERALLKVSACPALYNVLTVLGRSISSKSEGRFIANFTIRHSVLLGASITPGLARLSVKLRI